MQLTKWFGYEDKFHRCRSLLIGEIEEVPSPTMVMSCGLHYHLQEAKHLLKSAVLIGGRTESSSHLP